MSIHRINIDMLLTPLKIPGILKFFNGTLHCWKTIQWNFVRNSQLAP